MKELLEIWQKIEDYNIATKEEIKLVTDINGLNKEVLADIIFARTGYRSIEMLEDEMTKEGV